MVVVDGEPVSITLSACCLYLSSFVFEQLE